MGYKGNAAYIKKTMNIAIGARAARRHLRPVQTPSLLPAQPVHQLESGTNTSVDYKKLTTHLQLSRPIPAFVLLHILSQHLLYQMACGYKHQETLISAK